MNRRDVGDVFDQVSSIRPLFTLGQVWSWLIRNAAVLLPIIVIFIAAGLRLHLLGAQSIWNDEGNSLRLAQRPLAELLTAAAQDIHPPGYYVLLKGWIGLVGDSEFGLRSLSALTGLLTVTCVYALGKTLFASGAGLAAAALVALNSFQIYYSQEARMYAALALWTAASLWLFVRWIKQPKWQTGAMLAVTNVAGLYSHYTYPLVMLVQGLLFVLFLTSKLLALVGQPQPITGDERHRISQPLIGFIILNTLTIALFLPLLPTALRQISGWPHTGQLVDLGSGLATVLRWLIYGNTSLDGDWKAFFWPGVFIAVACLPDWLTKKPPFAWRLALPWTLIVVIAGSLFALNLFRDANLKFLISAQIGAALLIGRGAWLLWEIGSANLFIWREAAPRVISAIGMLAILYFSGNAINNLYTSPLFARDDYRAIAHVIQADPRVSSRDLLILDAPNQIEAFSYYYRTADPNTARLIGLPAGLGGDDSATHSALITALGAARRVYVLFWGEDERDPQHVVETTLNMLGYSASDQWFGNVRLALYGLPDVSSTPGDSPSTMLNVDFAGLIHLQGISLSSSTVQAGDILGIRLYWQADKAIDQRYKVFVQLLNANGQLVAQHDAEPANYGAPTSGWQPGQKILDNHGLALLPTLPAGSYHLIAGLYDSNGVRLPANNQDHAELGTVVVR